MTTCARSPRLRRAARVTAAIAAFVTPLGVIPGVARAQAQSGRCVVEFEGSATSATRFQATRVGTTSEYNTFAGGGVVAHCAGQPVTLRADSAEYYSGQGTLFLIGSVSYVEPRVRVNSQRMTYYQTEDRLLAEGNVDATLPSGTTMRGPQAEYFREIPGVRPRARLVAPGRPRFNIVQPDSTGRPPEPTSLVADRVTTDGDSLVYASGRVEIDRRDVAARGDSAYLDSGREFARLMRMPSIAGKGERPFTLQGTVLDLYSAQRQLQRVLAMSRAEAVSQDLRLTSDTIDLRVTGGQLERAYAWGASRARATSPERDIVADSLDVRLPNQRVREVRALRGAFAESVPDTARFRSRERDWLRGDTIVARFDSTSAPSVAAATPAGPAEAPAARRPAAPRDTANRPRIREIQASGNARSFYQLAPQRRDSAGRPSINYVTGRDITVAFDGQRVEAVTVVDRASGVYLEPGEDAAAPASAPAAGAARGGAPARTPAARQRTTSTPPPARRP